MIYRTDNSLITKNNLMKIADLVNQRNDLMKEVAECKVGLDLPIEDSEQEESVLTQVKLAAERLGLEPDSVIPFFSTLIHSAKELQVNYAGCLRCEIQPHSADYLPTSNITSIKLRALRSIICHINSRILVCLVQQLVLSPVTDFFRMVFTERLAINGLSAAEKQVLFNGIMQVKLLRTVID